MESQIRIFLLTTMMFLAYVLMYCQSSSLGMAIVCMVNHTTEAGGDHAFDNSSLNTLNDNIVCPNYEAQLTNNESSMNGVFNWPKPLQGHILSSYFFSYAVFHIPAGLLAKKYGGKLVLTLGLFIGTVATFLTPIAANAGWQYLITIRLFQGLGLAGPMPAISTILVECLPASYGTLICGITFAGIPIGLAVGMFISGYLCKHGFAGGWPSIFYIIGSASFLWLLVWVGIPTSDATTKCGSLNICVVNKKSDAMKKENKEKKKIPWLQLLTSKAVLAYIVGFVTFDWGFYILSTSVPTYIHEVLHFDIVENGLFIGISYVAMSSVAILTIVMSKKLIHSNVMSLVLTRKMFTSITFIVPSLSLVGLSYMNCSQPTLAKVLLITSVAFTGITFGSNYVNHVDIAPTYAGIIVGIANAIGTVTGIVVPQVTAALTPNKTREEWQVVFFISAGIYGFGMLVFNVFGSGKVQDWDKHGKETCTIAEVHIVTPVVNAPDAKSDINSIIKGNMNKDIKSNIRLEVESDLKPDINSDSN